MFFAQHWILYPLKQNLDKCFALNFLKIEDMHDFR